LRINWIVFWFIRVGKRFVDLRHDLFSLERFIDS
jgi:hypothetical protein